MLGLKKFLASLDQKPEEPIEPELKTTANKERDREIKYVFSCRRQQAWSEHQDRNQQLTAMLFELSAGSSRTCGQGQSYKQLPRKEKVIVHLKTATW
jgi:hypothetical protein